MKIKNPTNNDITVQIAGISYTVEAESELSNVPKEHAEQWLNIHEFLEVEKDVSEAKEDEVEEEVEEAKEDEVEEEVEEEPKKEEKKGSKLKNLVNKIK